MHLYVKIEEGTHISDPLTLELVAAKTKNNKQACTVKH